MAVDMRDRNLEEKALRDYSEEDFGCIRGFLYALPFTIVFWLGLIWIIKVVM